jgi:voltage-gated sodium channel
MSNVDINGLERLPGVTPGRLRWARWLESRAVQVAVVGVILINAAIMGLETNRNLMATHGALLHALDKACLVFFVVELAARMTVYRAHFWRSGWNWFDFIVVAVALSPGAGPWAVLRSLRVLRVLRLLTAVPQMRRVVAAILHSIPGLTGVVAVMAVFFYTAGVLSTALFGTSHPQWFGTLGGSLYSLFQIMTLESWSMGIVRPVMEVHGWAWAFFVPFIMIATFTILNLFIGIIVSTMQELAARGDTPPPPPLVESNAALLERMERDLAELRHRLAQSDSAKS